jgi:hypothetical protein
MKKSEQLGPAYEVIMWLHSVLQMEPQLLSVFRVNPIFGASHGRARPAWQSRKSPTSWDASTQMPKQQATSSNWCSMSVWNRTWPHDSRFSIQCCICIIIYSFGVRRVMKYEFVSESSYFAGNMIRGLILLELWRKL